MSTQPTNSSELTKIKSKSAQQYSSILSSLGSLSTAYIENRLPCCRRICWATRDFKVYDNKESKNLVFGALQDRTTCCEGGYLLIYKNPSDQIFGALGGHSGCIGANCVAMCEGMKYSFGCCFKYARCCDLRFVDSEQDAKDKYGGTYVATVTSPIPCCFLSVLCSRPKFEYIHAGDRFQIQGPCCNLLPCHVHFIIIEKTTQNQVGEIDWNYPCIGGGIESFEIKFPGDATPIEKMMILSVVFMIEQGSCFSLLYKDCNLITDNCTKSTGFDK